MIENIERLREGLDLDYSKFIRLDKDFKKYVLRLEAEIEKLKSIKEQNK